MKHSILLFLYLLSLSLHSQVSVHVEESRKYAAMGYKSVEEYDALSGFSLLDMKCKASGELEKIVFGYHPYWGGSNYLNYQWELLSDLCYFSYEVDPSTGGPVTYYDWLSTPAIDSAYAHGTRVHLCVTLFSGHAAFFENAQARQNLSLNLIDLVQQRGADGVSFDFELVPASQGENMISYLEEFAQAFRAQVPEGMISMAIPAVDWSGIYDIAELDPSIDLFMIMGYDYYWNGSTYAGPVDPHYSMTSGYDRSVARTLSYYQGEGMPEEKILLGVPYYAREWPTASGVPPSATTANGVALTWAKVRNNTSGHYSPENKHTELNSFGPYYAYKSNGWYQCFVNDENSLRRRYKMVNRRQLAGIGIWALGYDNAYTELWEVIDESFAQGVQLAGQDTIYDSGGPSWNYYNNEDYTLVLHAEPQESLQLEFTAFNLESGFDSLSIYEGYYPGGKLLGIYTGPGLPPTAYAMEVMSLRFKSDYASTASGWEACVYSFPIGLEEVAEEGLISIYPNPTSSIIHIECLDPALGMMRVFELNGNLLIDREVNGPKYSIDVSAFPSGIYILSLISGQNEIREKFVKF